MDERIRLLTDHGDKLFGQRSSLLSLWQTIAENFYVERSDFTSVRNLGSEFASHLTSSYPLLVRRELTDAISTMLRTDNWFSLSIEQDENLDNEGREWLEWATKVQRKAMYDRKAQFIRATKEADADFSAFGQCVISREMDFHETSLLYRCWHLRDVAWCERYNGEIGTIFRKWKPMLCELIKSFPQKVSQKVKDAAAKAPYDTWDCRHVVIRADDYESPSGKKWRTPYVSIYYELDSGNILQEVPSWGRIYTIPRWQTVSGSQYAYSPATVAGLPDARLLQAMTLTLLEAGEMAVRPPMIATKDAIRSDVQLFAGGITWADSEYDERLGEVLRPLTQDTRSLPFGMEISKDVQDKLAHAFYLNKLQLPSAGDGEMTAYEISQRIQEYIRNALPLFGPLETESNLSICEDTFEALMRVGTFGPPDSFPKSLRGAEIKFRFESPIHQAIERQKGQKFLESKQLLLEAVQLDPSSAAIMDAPTALRDVLAGIGTPAKWLRDEAVVAQMVEQQQEAQAAQQQLQQIHQAAATAEQVGTAGQALNGAFNPAQTAQSAPA